VGASGPTITSAGLVLAGTFLVLAVTAGGQPGGSQIRDIGLGLALGILMDTFLVRSLLVPSTVSLLGRWNWWPGKLAEMDHLVSPGASALAGNGRAGGLLAPPGDESPATAPE
jgi:RND superfamily putative drug exporter